jgi:hypothetical protein
MADDFMNDNFWDKHPAWCWDDKLTFRDAWNLAAKKLSKHFVDKGLRPEAEAPAAARDWLQQVVEDMVKYNPGVDKCEHVSQVTCDYLLTRDIQWKMAAHALLQLGVKKGDVNPDTDIKPHSGLRPRD